MAELGENDVIIGQKLLGEGKFGAVYEGLYPAEDTKVAVKIAKDNNPFTMQQFQEEIKWLGRLGHENLVTMIGHSMAETHRIVYKLATGGGLQSKIKALDWQQTLAIIRGIAAGISYLHSQYIRHGDIKTANVLLTQDLQPMLGDLASLRTLLPVHDQEYPLDENVTMTPGYFDPWSLSRHTIDIKDDIFSFGVIILQLLTKEDDEACVSGGTFLKKATKDFEKFGTIIDQKLLISGCSEKDAKALTRLALEMARYSPKKEEELSRMSIGNVIAELEKLGGTSRGLVGRIYMKAKFKVKKLKVKKGESSTSASKNQI